MLMFILIIIAGATLAYISQDNLDLVSVNVGPYAIADIPLFYVIIGSFISGLILFYIIHLFHMISSSWTIRTKKGEIKKNKNQVLELTKRIHQLELENEKLKHAPAVFEDTNSM
jgi:uncharacterized integral membrane protein